MRIYIDFKSPQAYLALKPTLALATKLGLVIEWCGFNAPQSVLIEQSANEDKGAVHRRVRAHARRAMHLHYAKIQAVPMRFPDRVTKTDAALNVLEALPRTERTAFVQRAFNAYWVESLDLNDLSVISSMLEEIGQDVANQEMLELWEGNEVAQSVDGVVDVPAYVVQDQLFIGREHLPWIEELLTLQ
ncbi:MAG: 2-hydroxychromene-2-carboxylate isomerase [Limisphaerales bacterium]